MSDQAFVGIGRAPAETRRAKLRRMAAQSVSPQEAQIARAMLSRLRESWEDDFADPEEHARLAAWWDIKEHERLADKLAAQRNDAVIADIVRRWERGTFEGITATADATGVRTTFGEPRR